MTREEAIEKAKEEGAVWMIDDAGVLLFWQEDEGRLTQCAVAVRVDDYRWLGWQPSIIPRPFKRIMERIV